MPGANAPPSSTVSWRPARRTASTRGPTSATSSSASPPIPIAAAPSYSRVTGRPPSPLPRRNPPTPPRFAPADTRRPARMRPHDAEWCSPDAYAPGSAVEGIQHGERAGGRDLEDGPAESWAARGGPAARCRPVEVAILGLDEAALDEGAGDMAAV